jgi:outer membrane murein-binding lipoprotein Lpp
MANKRDLLIQRKELKDALNKAKTSSDRMLLSSQLSVLEAKIEQLASAREASEKAKAAGASSTPFE